MPDTKIMRARTGEWIDIDNPAKGYPSRRLARDARRQYLISTGWNPPKRKPVIKARAPLNPVVNLDLGLTDLQSKLLRRMTLDQGVLRSDAVEILAEFGYNASASYGHMRHAGANHTEAKSVISMLNPDISVTYGKARAQGKNHTDALDIALHPPVTVSVVYMP